LKIKNFKYDEVGLNRFFGSLEARIMEIVWESDELSIKDAQAILGQEKSINFNTVMTVMNRLVDKGLLTKRSEGRLSLYRASQSKEAFIEEQSKKLTENLYEEFGGLVVSHMIDVLDEADAELLDRLERKIRELRKDAT